MITLRYLSADGWADYAQFTEIGEARDVATWLSFRGIAILLVNMKGKLIAY